MIENSYEKAYIKTMNIIRFKFSPKKAYAALYWMVNEHPGIDLHGALKTCYFADKDHLNAHQRPIFGATYRAMRFGPVPVEIYELAKGDPLWLAELGMDRLAWRLDGFRLVRSDNSVAEVDRSALSETDQTIFSSALARSVKMNFNERTAATHGRDWQAAELGWMRYEDMIDDTAHKAETLDYLYENARFMRL